MIFLFHIEEQIRFLNARERNTLMLPQFLKMHISDLGDFSQVVIPATYQKYTSRKVLTTQWIDGEKLSQSTASDVGELVNVGVICYLKQVIYF